MFFSYIDPHILIIGLIGIAKMNPEQTVTVTAIAHPTDDDNWKRRIPILSECECNPAKGHIFNLLKHKVIDSQTYFIGVLLYWRFRGIINNIMQQNCQLPMNLKNSLIVVTVLIANKLHDDGCFDNKTHASFANIPTCYLNMMELEFLLFIEFNVFVDSNGYNIFISHVLKYYGTYTGTETGTDNSTGNSTGNSTDNNINVPQFRYRINIGAMIDTILHG